MAFALTTCVDTSLKDISYPLQVLSSDESEDGVDEVKLKPSRKRKAAVSDTEVSGPKTSAAAKSRSKNGKNGLNAQACRMCHFVALESLPWQTASARVCTKMCVRRGRHWSMRLGDCWHPYNIFVLRDIATVLLPYISASLITNVSYIRTQ